MTFYGSNLFWNRTHSSAAMVYMIKRLQMSLLSLIVSIAGSLARLNSGGSQSWLLIRFTCGAYKHPPLPPHKHRTIKSESLLVEGRHLCFKDHPPGDSNIQPHAENH